MGHTENLFKMTFKSTIKLSLTKRSTSTLPFTRKTICDSKDYLKSKLAKKWKVCDPKEEILPDSFNGLQKLFILDSQILITNF